MIAAGCRVVLLAGIVLVAGCRGGDGLRADAGPDAPRGDAPADNGPGADATPDAGGETSPADGVAELIAVAGASRYALVGEDVVLDGSASVGATSFQWSLGDGSTPPDPGPDAVAHARYAMPGRYRAVLTVFDAANHRHSATVVISVTFPAIVTVPPSANLTAIPGTARLAVVVADGNQLVRVERAADDRFHVLDRIATGREPRTVASWKGWLAVACAGDDRVDLVPDDTTRTPRQVGFPPGARPFGVAASGETLYVTLQTTGALAEISLDSAGVPAIRRTTKLTPDARGVTVLPDGRVAVTRWRSPDARGEIAVFDPTGSASSVWPLAYDDRIPTDGASGGVPSYLEQLVVSPDGRTAVLPSLAANFGDGGFRNGRALTFESTVRGVVSFVDLPSGTERFPGRLLFDDRGFAAAAAFSPRGDYLYVAMRGNRVVERLDMLGGASAGTLIDAGYAPDGLLVTDDGRFLLVTASLSRELVIYDLDHVEQVPQPLERLSLVASEPLDPTVLVGKRLFNDSSDPRLSNSGYIACAHCHLDGDTDLRTWDFTDRGEGLRNTISLLGRAGGDGPLHWSANFDEIQDFENDIRNAFGGHGLMTDDDFQTDGRDKTLGAPKAGLSSDLDALASYVASLTTLPPSPFRQPDGTLSAAAARGKLLFQSPTLGCTTCHAGARLTDSRFAAPAQPVLHDVGTLGPGSGQRLGGVLAGLDTPTLHGLWLSPPYLHDGSAPDLHAVLRQRNPQDRHGATGQLTEAELADLAGYLLSLDGRVD